ncbi:MAG: acetyl-CoA synthetase [Chloroflexi bacterium RBG_16_56_11]|nr:MAG: acetyl-CoA synthetase [Chloroflexi bacterium RBG_16_56_11]
MDSLTQGKTKMLTEIEAKKLVKKAGVPVVDTRLAKTAREAAALGQEIGFPVVMKILSPDIIHKSDIGGVKVGLANKARLLKAYGEVMASVREKQPGARIEGVSVQKMAAPGVEIIIGMSKDPQFGPFLMFGLGGIWVEVLKDVSFRIVPVTRRDAAEMVREIKGFALLQGYRGQEAVDINIIESLIVKVSDFIEKNPQIKELDINPLIVYKDSAVAVDARVVLE